MARPFNEGNLALPVKNQMLRRGVVMFGITLIAGLFLAHTALAPAVRLVLFVPFFAAAYAIHLGLYGTCGFMAARGFRATEDGVEVVADKDARCRFEKIGFRVIGSSLTAAVVATFVFAFATT